MQQLKKDVIESMDKVNQAWVDAVKEAEKELEKKEGEGELDLTEIISKYSTVLSHLMIKFDEAEIRSKKKKGGFF